MRKLYKVNVNDCEYDYVIVDAENSAAAEVRAIKFGFFVSGSAEPISETQASEIASSEKTYCLSPVMTGLLP